MESSCSWCSKKITLSNKQLKWKTHFCNQDCKAKSMIGHKMSEENKLKLIIAHSKPQPLEVKRKISLANSGEKNGMWDYYSSRNSRARTRKRDNYICLMCNERQRDRSLDVHHIDYNPKNNLPQNLITLCHSCHAKTNKSKREFWITHCHSLLSEKYNYKYLNGEILINL